MGIRRYITDEYDDRLAEYVAAQPEITRPVAERRFVETCRQLEETLKDDTPPAVIRRLAFHQLEWHPPTDASDDPDGSTDDDGQG
ncbi:hypothetical protein [Natronobiforma cellulositropha]|uniref:hypothetical protein n=1 Tax=Natronobiforma cellulositropha TaxID=1679076 RepID=UPI0021D5DFB3|nr:hypothetical protein [Natronobiforma cellulositropha]